MIVDDLSNSSLEVLEGIRKITSKEPLFVQLDLKEQDKVKQLFEEHYDIDSVLHFAASKAVGESVKKPIDYYQNNITGLLYLIQSLSHPINFVFSSSCTVYGQASELPITESTPTQRPESPYGNTKKICEEILEDAVLADRDLKAICLRYFNPIGAHPSALIGENPKDVPQNLVPFVTQSAIGKLPPLTVYGNDYPTPDGTCIRDYIHVMDLAEAHCAALEYCEKQASGSDMSIVNLGTGTGHSVLEVITSFERVSGSKLKYTIGPRREGDIIAAYASIEKAQKILNWTPKFSLDDALASAWIWEQKNNSAPN